MQWIQPRSPENASYHDFNIFKLHHCFLCFGEQFSLQHVVVDLLHWHEQLDYLIFFLENLTSFATWQLADRFLNRKCPRLLRFALSFVGNGRWYATLEAFSETT